MNSGLYGCSGLPGGTTTTSWQNESNFSVRSVSPVAAVSRVVTRHQHNIRHETGLRPEDIRRLVQALSIPEIMHVLKSWHIEHPSGRPLGDRLHKHALVDLIVEHNGALGDVIRIATARAGARAVGSGPGPIPIRLCGARSATPGYSSLLHELSVKSAAATGAVLHSPPRAASVDLLAQSAESRASNQPSQALSVTSLPSAAAAEPADSTEAGGANPQGTAAERSRRRLRLTGEQRGLLRSLSALRTELAAERAAREDCSVRLARRGLLSVALDADMAPPVARSRDRRVEAVRRCGITVGELRAPPGVNKYLTGVRVDADMIRRAGAGPAAYGPSALTLCP